MRYSFLLLGLLMAGCRNTLIVHRDYKGGELTRKVMIYRGEGMTVSDTKGLSVDYLGVKASVDSDTTRGDAESITAIGNAITAGILAYGTYGAAPAVNAAVNAALARARPSVTNSPAVK